MATIIRYQPQGVILPTELVQKHADLFKYSIGSSYFNTRDVDRCYPLIHDMFRSRDDKHIIAMDSACMHGNYTLIYVEHTARVERQFIDWSGLKKDLLPLKIYHNKKPLNYRYRISPYKFKESQKLMVRMTLSVGFYEIDLTAEMQSKDKIELEWVWNNWSQTRVIERNPFRTLKPTPFILHTTQRDNHPIWIHDWCAYYRREHGVQRIVLYDNGSKDVQAYINQLQSINDAMEIVVIAWPYSYDSIFSNTQLAALNHCPAIFTDLARYYLNFDIDEYLLNPSKYSLKEYLMIADSVKRASYMVTSHNVPSFSESTRSNTLPRAANFKHIAKYQTYTHTKTINIYNRFEYISVHITYPLKEYRRPSLKSKALLWRILLKPITRKTKNRISSFYYRLQEVLLQEIARATWLQPYVQLLASLFKFPIGFNERKYFLTLNHYDALTTNWNNPSRDKKVSTLDHGTFELDTLMPEKLQKHGLVSQSTQSKK